MPEINVPADHQLIGWQNGDVITEEGLNSMDEAAARHPMCVVFTAAYNDKGDTLECTSNKTYNEVVSALFSGRFVWGICDYTSNDGQNMTFAMFPGLYAEMNEIGQMAFVSMGGVGSTLIIGMSSDGGIIIQD